MYGQYPKEYDEALSRLEASERSPLPYAPLPYGPVPNHCNYMNWNRIMAETRQGVLPKYSILQRIDLGSQNDLVNVSDAKEYTYTLDPSFTFAKGARKSIAVRAVDIYNVIPKDQSITVKESFSGQAIITYRDLADIDPATNQPRTKTGTVRFSDITYICSNDLGVSMTNFAKAVGSMIYTQLAALSAGSPIVDDIYLSEYDSTDNTLKVRFTANTLLSIVYTSWDAVGGSEPRWRVNLSSNYDYYNVEPGFTDVRLRVRKVINLNMLEVSFQLPSDIIDVRKAAICGSINPWTKNNLIAPITYSSDTLTKVFPWNGCTEAKFWFINDKGEKVRWRVVRGYIDLELIIDNSDTYAIDND